MNIQSVSAARLFRICAAATAIVMASGEVAQAQMPLGTQDLEIVCPPSGGRFLSWQPKEGRTYFIQVSTQHAPLAKWTFSPLIEYGSNQAITIEITSTAPSAFFRLKYTDMPVGENSTPEDTDFDGDGISSHDEIWLTHTDPLAKDTDGDGMDDGWEDRNYLDPNDATGDNGASGDPDQDGIDNLTEFNLDTKPQIHDTDGDGISDGGEQDIGTDPLDDASFPETEWVIVSGTPYVNGAASQRRTVSIPAGRSCVLPVVLVSDEYPNYTGQPSEFNDVVTWRITPAGGLERSGSVNVNSRHAEWEVADLAGISCHGLGPAIVEDGLTLTAPNDAPLEVEIEVSSTNIGDGDRPSTVMVGVLPIEPVEFFPALLDGDENEIAGSQNPRTEPGQTNGMVEEDPADNRIAHREIRMRIVDGSILVGHNLTWSIDPLFMPLTGGPAVFRGYWEHAAEGHRDRFESSGHYGAHGFDRASQSSATTELQSDVPGGVLCGSAIRANLPPIGFNKGRLRVAIQGIAGNPAKVADIEVPAVVVLDAGHSSTDPGNQAGGYDEADLTEEYADETRTSLHDLLTARQPFHRVLLTERGANPTRPALARTNGADIFLSIHFNDGSPSAVGAETLIRGANNVNEGEDNALATRVQEAAVNVVGAARSPGVKNYMWSESQQADVPSTWTVLQDESLGNDGVYHTTRGCIQEVDFMSNAISLSNITGPESGPVLRANYAAAIAAAIISDIEHQP